MKNRTPLIKVSLIYLCTFSLLEWLIRQNFISRALVPRPSQLLYLYWTEHLTFTTAFLQTGAVSLIAFILASLLAFFLGIFVHLSVLTQKTVLPLSLFLQTVPIVAIAPLLVIYFGFSSLTTLTAGVIVCFFPVLIATVTGLSQAKTSERELLQFLKATRYQKLVFLEIPTAVPAILAGLKTSAGLAVIGVVSGEFLVGGGLGSLIDSSRLQQRVDFVFASLILLAILGLSLMLLTQQIFTIFFKKYLARS